MTRDEEGGCRPLFQGISNVLKNDINLKPCPFCGSKAKLMQSCSPYISCENGHEFSPRHYKTVDELVKEWNTRKGEPGKCCTNCKHWKNYWDHGSDADEDYGNGDCDHFKQPTAYDERCAFWEVKE